MLLLPLDLDQLFVASLRCSKRSGGYFFILQTLGYELSVWRCTIFLHEEPKTIAKSMYYGAVGRDDFCMSTYNINILQDLVLIRTENIIIILISRGNLR